MSEFNIPLRCAKSHKKGVMSLFHSGEVGKYLYMTKNLTSYSVHVTVLPSRHV